MSPALLGAMPTSLRLWVGSHADDMAATRDLLSRVSAGLDGPTLRIYEPRPTVAFSLRETHREGYQQARAAAVRHGFAPVVRLAGGRAVAYGPGCLVVEVIAGDAAPVRGVTARFDEFAGALAGALNDLTVRATVGQVEGEYCPGEHSVVLARRGKLAGTAQRLVARAWLCTAAIVVADPTPLREVLTDVNAALAYEWRPATLAAVTDEAPGLGVAEVSRAVLRRLAVGAP